MWGMRLTRKGIVCPVMVTRPASLHFLVTYNGTFLGSFITEVPKVLGELAVLHFFVPDRDSQSVLH